MAVVQANVPNQPRVSLPRRIATYITSMNLAKVFRRHHQHHPRESSSPAPKPSQRSPLNHQHPHRYNRPFSYHIPKTEQIPPPTSSSTRPASVIPYRIGLSGDSTLLGNAAANDTTDIVRLPTKTGKDYKGRRYHSQFNANKRWLFRSMETLDGWKGKVFSPKTQTPNSSQSRSRSVENLADRDLEENVSIGANRVRTKQQRALSPNRSIETITNRVINSIGIHRKSTSSIPHMTRSPALTIEKQSTSTRSINAHHAVLAETHREVNPSAILDFHEISSLGFSQAKARLTDNVENISLSPSENYQHGLNSNDDENEEIASDLSFFITGHDAYQQANGLEDTTDPWDFTITWIDSLKEQQSPQRKIQFYENLIKLLEQDTLNIDELLVLRKVLAKIWPSDEPTTTTASPNSHNPINFLDLKQTGTKSLHAPNRIKRRSKLSTLTRHTAQRCSAILEQTPLVYESMHEQKSGHEVKPPTLTVQARASPCVVEDPNQSFSNQSSESHLEPTYPQHLNPFHDETDTAPSAPPKEFDHPNNASIRRYFERLTLLETIYEKLSMESNRTPLDSVEDRRPTAKQGNTTESATERPVETKPEKFNQSHPPPTSHIDLNKSMSNRFLEMNVDGNGSISSGRSSGKRRAPTAPHVSQADGLRPTTPKMFTLLSADVHASQKSSQEINIPIQIISHNGKTPTEVSPKDRTPPPAHQVAASCDDDGHIFVYDTTPDQPTHEEAATLPKRTERIREWLSSCERREEPDLPVAPQNTSPRTQLKIRCSAKPMRYPSPSRASSPTKQPSPSNRDELEPGRFVTSLKIHLESNEPIPHRSRLSSATSRQYERPQTTYPEDSSTSDYRYFPRHALSPSFSRDHQAVYL